MKTKKKFIDAVSISLVILQLFHSAAFAGFLYLPFDKAYSPTNYVYDSYSLSRDWPTYKSRDGNPHTGTDYRGDGYGTSVYAAYDGTVVAMRETENDGCDITYAQQLRYGNYVKIDHQVGSVKYRTEYWHLKQNGVVTSVGKKIKTGDLIAYVSNSGRTAGSNCAIRPDLPYGAFYHLHFEFKKWDGKKWMVLNPYGPTWFWATNPPTPATQAGPTPCTYSIGQDSSRKSLFEQAYSRNGGRNKLGCPSAPTYWWKAGSNWVVRQDFSGAVIIQHEGVDDTSAYVVQSTIWNYYKVHSSLGAPVSDQFKNSYDSQQSNFKNGFIFVNSAGSAVPVVYGDWYWVTEGEDTTLNASFQDAEGGGVQLILDGLGGTGGWVSGAVVAKEINGIPVTPQTVLVWDQYDKAHSLHFILTILDKRGETHSLTYSANAPNVWGTQGYVDMGSLVGGYNIWKIFARNIFVDYRAEWGTDPVSISRLRLSHYLHDSWVGDRGGTVKNIAFDDEAPVTEIEIVPDFPDGGEGWYLSPPLVELIATDDASGVDRIEYNLGSGWQTFTDPFLVNLEGETILQYRAVDRAGHVEATKTQIFKVDTYAPQTSLSSFGPYYENEEGKAYVSDQTLFELFATDETSGVAETEYVYYGVNQDSGVQTYTGPFSLEGDEGRNTVLYQSVDNSGNVEEVKSQEFYLDSTTPVSSDDSDGVWHNEDVTVTITSQDPVATGEAPGSGVQNINYGGTQEGDVLGDQAQVIFTDEGTHELTYYATDNVENTEELKQANPIKIDKTPPEISGASTDEPNENGWYNEDVTVNFEAADQEHLSGVKSVMPDVIISTEGANQSVVGVAEDNAGNIAETTVEEINIDKTKPESALYPIDSYYNEIPIELSYEYDDNLSGVDRVRLYKSHQGGDWQYHSGSSREPDRPFVVGTLDEGSWRFSSCAVDLAGNEECNISNVGDINGAQAAIIYDINTPNSEITSVREGGYYNIWPGIFGTVNDINLANPSIETSGVAQVEVMVSVGGGEGEWIGVEGTDEWALVDFYPEDGFYTTYSRGADRAGNRYSILIYYNKVSFVYDTVNPLTSSLISGTNGLNGWHVSPVGLVLSAADATAGVSQTFYTIGETDPQEYVEPLEFVDGTYAVEFWSVDKAGNEEEQHLLSLEVDTIVPIVPVASVAGGGFFTGDQAIVTLSGEEGSQIHYSLDGGEPTLYTEPLKIKESSTLSVFAVDYAGNQSAEISWDFVFEPKPVAFPQVLGAAADQFKPTTLAELLSVSEDGAVQGVEIAAEDGGGQGRSARPMALPAYLVIGICSLAYIGIRLLRLTWRK
ncbi:MAG: hypothetical protein XU08_C0001G0025 [candidate division WWE3 bacterium CSP1-7]|uniref:Uncharacterized protein n=1 Tax=candidate division WWE3 bacterium CSP1-7 TaxID=1576480 RepID=A0A0T5ZXT2_UNCKA|nr:MAG: hypothetical protein XU08_C0001G0025 [candidate division WWE3 bacterium CSP1-7]HJZ06311.1 chitobiase/beta-hexosaminidase C-terminal domain-containing protein [Patescibacteria group bacterium]